MLRCRAMPPMPDLPETREWCPFCGSKRLELRGRVPAGAGMSKMERWCTACEREIFWFTQSDPLSEQLPPPSPRAA